MSETAKIYYRATGEKVAAWSRPVDGQFRFVAEKRTAVDGKTWWSIYDNEKGEFVPSKFHTRKNCENDIVSRFRHGTLPRQPNAGAEVKTKKYAVDVHCDLAKCLVVEAASAKAAEEIVWKKVWAILAQPNPYPVQSLIAEGFETTDDAEVTCSGEEDENGDIEYY